MSSMLGNNKFKKSEIYVSEVFGPKRIFDNVTNDNHIVF